MALSAARHFLQNGATAFVRPDSDSKVFEGAVYDAFRLEAVTKQSAVPSATPVVVASPLNIGPNGRVHQLGHPSPSASLVCHRDGPSRCQPACSYADDGAQRHPHDLALCRGGSTRLTT